MGSLPDGTSVRVTPHVPWKRQCYPEARHNAVSERDLDEELPHVTVQR